MVSIEHDVVGTAGEASLPNAYFHPGLVSMRRCNGCGELDRRTWYASTVEALEMEAKRATTWSCRTCASAHSSFVRSWFDSAYAPL